MSEANASQTWSGEPRRGLARSVDMGGATSTSYKGEHIIEVSLIVHGCDGSDGKYLVPVRPPRPRAVHFTVDTSISGLPTTQHSSVLQVRIATGFLISRFKFSHARNREKCRCEFDLTTVDVHLTHVI